MEKTVYYIEKKKKGHGSQREYYMSNPARRLYARECVCVCVRNDKVMCFW